MQKVGVLRFLHITKSALNPRKLIVMLGKVYRRLFDKSALLTQNEYSEWLDSHGVRFEQWAGELSNDLYQESLKFSDKLYSRAKIELANNPHDMGGGGLVHVLYFLTRYYSPKTIVETGVASGYSSEAFLQAIKVNGNNAHLFSSDFPYFRFSNPESYIGQLVSDEFKDDWNLFVDGDDTNLKNIVNLISTIDFFHYDSDKSYTGREKAFNTVRQYLSSKAIVMFDDINNNPHFYDFIQKNSIKNFVVIRHKGSCVAGIAYWE